jgi:hypothetical protein
MVGNLPNGRLVSEAPFNLGPHPGRDSLIVGTSAEVRARMYIVPAGANTRLFFLMVRGIDARPTASDVAKFFDSFSYKAP